MKNYIQKIKKEFSKTPDLITKKLKINIFHEIYIIFLETLCSQNKINDYILKSLTSKNYIGKLENYIPGGNLKILNVYDEIEYYLYSGYTIILDKNKIYAIETKADINRSVSTNETEASLKGPKNAFIENYQTNLGLIKKRIKSHHLKTKTLNIGRLSNTTIGILYIDNITKIDLVNDVYDKLKKIDIDIINDSDNLVKYLNKASSFPTAITTERPDRCAKALADGKVVILCDESAYALILPAFLVDFINPFSDNYSKNSNINFTKLIRMLCFFLSATVPSFYISIINYNQEAIPTSLIINFAAQRDGVPFPAIIECIIMLVMCEILRESDLRFPSKYGSAVSILGALVLGDAAVQAGLVSPIMIIITAFTYISSLIFSEQEIVNGLRLYRFIFIVLCALFGLYGLIVGFIFFVINLCNTTSSGFSYTFPLAPYDQSYFNENFLKKKNKYRSNKLSKNLKRKNA